MFWKGITASDGLSGSGSTPLGGSAAAFCRNPRHRHGKSISAAANGLNAAASGSPVVENPAKCGDLNVEIAVFDCGLRPDCGNDLGARNEFPGPHDQHVEYAECTRADRERDEDAALILSGQDPAPSIEADPPEKANIPGGRCGHATTPCVLANFGIF